MHLATIPVVPLGSLLVCLLALAALLGLAFALWLRRERAFLDVASVANAYDRWTEDALLETLWGEHVHLGHYGNPPRRRDFRAAKEDLVHALVHWSGLDQLPAGSRVLDVGCGIGGSARILARDYGLDVLAISISPAQITRAQALTPAPLSQRCRFAVMDALHLDLPDAAFDAVWSVEASPHMPDKQRYADELLRVLRPGGLLAVADWNRRDPGDGEMSAQERWVMDRLLNQWAHPAFASIRSLKANLETSLHADALEVETDDWTRATLPSWIDSILEGFRRPAAVLALGPAALLQGLRETPTLLLMDWAFRTGLMQFGVFRASKALAPTAAGALSSAGRLDR